MEMGTARSALALLAVCASALAATSGSGWASSTPTLAPPPPVLPTSASLAASLSPDRLGARGALAVAIRYAGGTRGVPSPVRRVVLELPAELSLEIPRLRSCSAARLRAHGPRACPAQSRIAHGSALAEARIGSVLFTEHVTLSAFVGPLRGIEPTLELFGRGLTPFDERVLLTGTLGPAPRPYGETLTISIPRIRTLRFERAASLTSLALTFGTSHPARASNVIRVPRRCPAGGFPFTAAFTYADGTGSTVTAVVPCPPSAAPPSQAGRG